MTTTKNTLLGRPIHGDITQYSSKTPIAQWDTEQFLELLDAVLAFDSVEAIRWQQYTPYFNDGDACEFSVYEPRIKFVGKDDGGDYEDGYLDDYSIAEYPMDYFDTHDYPRWSFDVNGVRVREVPPGKLPVNEADKVPAIDLGADSKDIVAAYLKLSGVMDHFEVALKEHFGDPAEVTATRAGFSVEYYDHD